MRVLSRRMLGWVLLGTAVAVASVVGGSGPARAVGLDSSALTVCLGKFSRITERISRSAAWSMVVTQSEVPFLAMSDFFNLP